MEKAGRRGRRPLLFHKAGRRGRRPLHFHKNVRIFAFYRKNPFLNLQFDIFVLRCRRTNLRHDLVFKPEVVRYHCDKLRIRGFSAGILYRIAEKSVEYVKVAPVPGDFYGVADRAFNAGRRRGVLLCDRRIKHLRDRIYRV